MKALGSLGAVLAGLAWAGNVAAQTAGSQQGPAVVLRWNAPAECPTHDQVLSDVRSLASDHGAPLPFVPIAVDAVVERLAAERWRLTLAVGAAKQQIEASSCVQLGRAAALFLALIMDPSSGEPPGGALGASALEARPPVLVPPSTPTPAASPTLMAEASDRDVHSNRDVHSRGVSVLGEVLVLAAAGIVTEVGTLPRAELLGALEVGIRYRRVEITLRGEVGPAQEATAGGTVGARLTPFSATLMPCYAPLVTRGLRLGPCAQAEVGWIHAEGISVSQPLATDAAWLSVGGELVAWWVLGAHFEARLGAGALIPAVRPDLQLTGYPAAARGYQTGPRRVFEPGMAACAGAAAVLRF
jgi:hypothetical protein